MQLSGLHHLTAISADIKANRAFYTGVLGLRLVKKSINQDDVKAYHLYYADGLGSPGSDITFFDWQREPERRGTGSISRTSLRVADAASLAWWHAHLSRAGVSVGEFAERDGRQTFDFEDPEGQRLAVVLDAEAGPGHPWEKSPVPPQHQIRGIGPVTLCVADLAPTDRLLGEALNMRPLHDYRDPCDGKINVHVYTMGAGGAAAELHVAVAPDLPRAQEGAGGAHHVALRTPDDEQYAAWAERLDAAGVRNSGKIDRYYFRSLYFRDPNGILFEIATDGPGFTTDEPVESLGQRLSIPPFLEARRAEIEAGLKPI
jgi:glyoxalase family protein